MATTSRSIAINILHKVFQGRSLSGVKKDADVLDARERALAMELVNGVLRWRWKLEYLLSQLMKKPLRNKEQEIKLLLLLGLYELVELSTPEYAVINESVELTKSLRKNWASGLVNGVLRSFARDKESLLAKIEANEVAHYSHPEWLINILKRDWPDHWQDLLQANNQRPPLWLRVNALQTDAEQYAQQLASEDIQSTTHRVASYALKLERNIDVISLPGFGEGWVSVQDAGAQLAAGLLDVHAGHRVLDLCAAPGGKTSHILEHQPGLDKLVAVELDAMRMRRVRENLDRLQLDAELVVADAADVSSWWDGESFDRILVDAPCSATGVIRRHPDIKTLRREEDLSSLVQTQQQVLQAAWSVLKPGGLLVYVTCSVLRRENEEQIDRLLKQHNDAEEVALNVSWGTACEHGRQLLPGEDDGDGFYYACIHKVSG